MNEQHCHVQSHSSRSAGPATTYAAAVVSSFAFAAQCTLCTVILQMPDNTCKPAHVITMQAAVGARNLHMPSLSSQGAAAAMRSPVLPAAEFGVCVLPLPKDCVCQLKATEQQHCLQQLEAPSSCSTRAPVAHMPSTTTLDHYSSIPHYACCCCCCCCCTGGTINSR
jgi:hypothetical protein